MPPLLPAGNRYPAAAVSVRRKSASLNTCSRYRTAMNATAVASMAAIHGTCSLISIAKACSQRVDGSDSSSARGYRVRSVSPSGGGVRYGGKTIYAPPNPSIALAGQLDIALSGPIALRYR